MRSCLPNEHYLDEHQAKCTCGAYTREQANAVMPMTQGEFTEWKESGSTDPFHIWFRKKYPI